jgi:hypothetical protein
MYIASQPLQAGWGLKALLNDQLQWANMGCIGSKA